MIEVFIPVRTCSEANLRVHWAERARRARGQRGMARAVLRSLLWPSLLLELKTKWLQILLTRIAPRKLDSDNLCTALKAVRDGVADALNRDDGDPLIEWNYLQSQGRPSEYAVQVRIFPCS